MTSSKWGKTWFLFSVAVAIGVAAALLGSRGRTRAPEVDGSASAGATTHELTQEAPSTKPRTSVASPVEPAMADATGEHVVLGPKNSSGTTRASVARYASGGGLTSHMWESTGLRPKPAAAPGAAAEEEWIPEWRGHFTAFASADAAGSAGTRPTVEGASGLLESAKAEQHVNLTFRFKGTDYPGIRFDVLASNQERRVVTRAGTVTQEVAVAEVVITDYAGNVTIGSGRMSLYQKPGILYDEDWAYWRSFANGVPFGIFVLRPVAHMFVRGTLNANTNPPRSSFSGSTTFSQPPPPRTAQAHLDLSAQTFLRAEPGYKYFVADSNRNRQREWTEFAYCRQVDIDDLVTDERTIPCGPGAYMTVEGQYYGDAELGCCDVTARCVAEDPGPESDGAQTRVTWSGHADFLPADNELWLVTAYHDRLIPDHKFWGVLPVLSWDRYYASVGDAEQLRESRDYPGLYKIYTEAPHMLSPGELFAPFK